MKYLRLTGLCIGLTAAGFCAAADTAFCQSMCTSEQSECRVAAQSEQKQQSLTATNTNYRNPLERTAEGEVRSQSARALSASGDTYRRLDQSNTCETNYQRCVKTCTAKKNPINKQ